MRRAVKTPFVSRVAQFRFLGLLLICFSQIAPSTYASEQSPTEQKKMAAFISKLMAKMTVGEKVGQLVQYSGAMNVTGGTIYENYQQEIEKGRVGSILNNHSVPVTRQLQRVAVENTRLKIPLLFGLDVIHGYRTIFPIPLGEAASWDLERIERSARIAATEAAADGIHWTFAPMVDISRDPRWGRVSEGAGEDPWLGSLIGKARVRGFQGKNLKDVDTILATIKHFAVYGAPEGGRDYNVVDLSHRTLREVYLPPYKAAVEAGAGSVMTSFNEVDSLPATGNRWLLRDLLRKEWGFKGVVVTDYTAVNEMINHGTAADLKDASIQAFNAGVDIDMVGAGFATYLEDALKQNKITRADLDAAVRRVLEAKYKLGLFEDPYRYCDEERSKKTLMHPDHMAFAKDLAKRSVVLLKNNNNVLPLKRSGTIALIGPLADNKRELIGNWSATGEYKDAISLLEGLTKGSQGLVKILHAKGANVLEDEKLIQDLNGHGAEIKKDVKSAQALLEEAVKLAKQADVVVLALGETQGMSGEAASMTRIQLAENQKALVRAIAKVGKPTVMVLFNGRPMVLTEENNLLDAMLVAWFGGTQAGPAIADVLFGDYNPAGKLTMSFPFNEGQIPVYYSAKNTGRPKKEGDKYTSRYLDAPNEPLFPFGWGLSYTSFIYSKPKVSLEKMKMKDKLTVSVSVTNTGGRAGEEVVQLYVRDVVSSVTRPLKQLRGFQKIHLNVAETKTLEFQLTAEDLKFYNKDMKWVAEPGEYRVMLGSNSKDTQEVAFSLVK